MGVITEMKIRLGAHGSEILRLHKRLDGMLAVSESAWLYRSAAGKREIVEIGSYRGKSCTLLAKGCAAVGGRVTAIDPHIIGKGTTRYGTEGEDRRLLLETIRREGVAERVTEMVMTSREALAAWDGRAIDLLWIDGDHSEEGAAFDIEAWGALVRSGGIMAAHDYTRRKGVRAAWDRLVTRERGWGPTKGVRSIVWAQRA